MYAAVIAHHTQLRATDAAWLKAVNAKRVLENAAEVSEQVFETIMDRLEKEWFDLVKDVQRHAQQEPLTAEESVCNICYSGECDNSNAIVFCDGTRAIFVSVWVSVSRF